LAVGYRNAPFCGQTVFFRNSRHESVENDHFQMAYFVRFMQTFNASAAVAFLANLDDLMPNLCPFLEMEVAQRVHMCADY